MAVTGVLVPTAGAQGQSSELMRRCVMLLPACGAIVARHPPLEPAIRLLPPEFPERGHKLVYLNNWAAGIGWYRAGLIELRLSAGR